MFINNIKKNEKIFFQEYRFDNSVIKQRGNLYDAVKVVLEFNETIQSDLT